LPSIASLVDCAQDVRQSLSDADRARLAEKRIADTMATILATADRHRAELDAAAAGCSKRLGMAIPGYSFGTAAQ
jgi:hypothetical protein